MNEKIILIDDDHIVIDLIKTSCTKYNYTIITAEDGKEGYKKILEYKPDIVITDWKMPVMDGLELVEKIRKLEGYKDMPIIMITGFRNTNDNLKLAFDAGVTDFIHKPINIIELIARTKSALQLASYHKQVLKSKNMELTYLAKNIFYNNEFNAKLVEALESFSDNYLNNMHKANDEMSTIINQIKYKLKEQTWEDFERKFKTANPTFIDHMIQKFPKLTSSDIRLSILLRLQMSSKEIASITFQNPESVDIGRYRLRKKLGLNRSDNLYSFLLKM